MQEYIQKLWDRQNLTEAEIQAIMRKIMLDDASYDEMSEFMLALNHKGPTITEITGAAKLLRGFGIQVRTQQPVVLDTCGTGGDRAYTFNISTIVAFVVAGAGVIVAKHGNRSISSRCGSADLLEAMGINLKLSSEDLSKCLDEVGIAFLFAPMLHPAMKNVAAVRKALNVETVFNILGPLLNPAKATHQMMGVYRREYVEPLAHVLKNLGLRRALVVHGSDGLDEITITGKTFASEYNGREVISYDINPEELGFKLATPGELKGGELGTNMAIARDILHGGRGPKRDIVVLNAAYALYCSELAQDVYEGNKLAELSLNSKKAAEKLEELKAFTQKHRVA